MEPAKLTYNELLSEIEELRIQLEEAHDTIEAIRSGQVDALIVRGDSGHQLYTLKTADQTYRMFIEKMNEGAVTLSREGTILYSNSRFAEMVNMSLEKVIGIKFDTFIADGEKNSFYKVIESGWERECKEEIILHSENRTTPCLLSCNTLELDEGTALSLILTDLSLQKKAENLLKINNEKLIIAQNATEKLNNELEDTVKSRTADLLVSREHFKLLSDSIPQMTWTNLPNGDVNFYNKRWYDYTGLTFEETKKWGWQAVVHPDDINHTTERYLKSLQTGDIFEVENRYKRHDGVYRWHLNRATPLKDDKGEILFWVGTATDIDDQKQQMERKDEFIGIASHELKTPVTSIKAYTQVLEKMLKQRGDEKEAAMISRMDAQLNRLTSLIGDLLDVTKINSGKLLFNDAEFDFNAHIEDLLEDLSRTTDKHAIIKNFAPTCTVYGDKERIGQVITNLVTNAIKYSPHADKIIVTSSVKNNEVTLCVQDFGIGIAEDNLNRVFEQFYRVSGDMQRTFPGLGLGLYISSEIIKREGGRIWVTSQEGKGSTFCFALPLKK